MIRNVLIYCGRGCVTVSARATLARRKLAASIPVELSPSKQCIDVEKTATGGLRS